MSSASHRRRSSLARWTVPCIFTIASLGFLLIGMVGHGAPAAEAAGGTGVGLGTASSFAVLAGSTVTNTGPTIVRGDLVEPGSAVVGFPPGRVLAGTQHIADPVALQAKNDLTTAYNQAASAPTGADVTGKDLGGMTLIPGVYEASTSMALTGALTLNAQGDPAAVFIFKAGTTLLAASNSSVHFINGGSPCNVYWQVGSSATLQSATSFIGTIMARASATLETGANVQGRVLAMSGAVTLDTNVITVPRCATPPTGTPTPTATPTATTTPSTGPSGSSTPTTPRPPSGSSGAGRFPSTTPGGPGPGGGGVGPPAAAPPRIPTGHPHTGLGGSQQTAQGRPWFAASALAGAGALVFAGLAYSRERSTRRRA